MSLSRKKCCVPGCMDSKSMRMPLHLFPNPAKDKHRFNTWVMSIGGDIIGLDNDDIYKHRSVCHAHFEEKYCCRFNKLSNIAVPTLNLPGPLSLPKFTFAERRPLQEMQNVNMTMHLPSTSRDPVSRIPSVFESALEVPEVLSIVIQTPIAVPEEETTNATQFAPVPNLANNRCSTDSRYAVAKKVKSLSILEHKVYRQLIQVKAKLSKYRSKIKRLSANIKTAKKLTSNPAFTEAIQKLPSTARILTMLQFREIKKEDKGRRFTLEEKIIALSILKQSPKCYRFLRKMLILPAPQTLTKLLNTANVQPGINKKLFAQIKKATENLKVQDRLCILLFDEMALTANLTYNERKDRVIGFVTDGKDTKPEYADHAQVFMVRGLMRNYKQPVAYTFSAAATKGPELAKQIKQVIRELQEAGLIVVATVCDQGTNNRSAIQLLTQETRGTFLRTGRETNNNIFMVDDQEIIPLYDPPHLIKCIRNNLITKNLMYKTDGVNQQVQIAKWQHIEMLYDENPGYKGIRLIPKLTENHVIPKKISKMKVKYATQVFSQTVTSNMGYLADKGILPKESKETADVLLFFDRLFDSVNGSYSSNKPGKPLLAPARPSSTHHQLWNKSRNVLKTMKFVNVMTGRSERVPTIDNWVWTLDGIQILLKKLEREHNVTSVWMRHLNQDPIENFFGSIRSHGGRNTNPSIERFESAYASLIINNLTSVHAPGANCEKDFCEILSPLLIADDCVAQTTTSSFEIVPDVEIVEISQKTDPRIMGPLPYVSGYFINHTAKKVYKGCKTCQKDMKASDENEYINCREYAGRHWLNNPSPSFLSCMSAVQDINNGILKQYVHQHNIKEIIKTMIFCHMSDEFDFISCPAHKEKVISHLINLSSRFYIYNYCKEINKILIGRRDAHDNDDQFQMKAKKYLRKCCKRKNK